MRFGSSARRLASRADMLAIRGSHPEHSEDKDEFITKLKKPRPKDAILEDHARLVREMEAREALERGNTDET